MSIAAALKIEFNRRVFDEGVWRIERVLSGLTESEVWFAPNDAANSIGHLILHLCGNVTQWMGTGIGGSEDLRERDLEFATKEQHHKEVLLQKLHALRPITDLALEGIIDDSHLLEARSVQGYEETVLSILVHVVEHFSYHTGQIALIAKYLKGQDLGFYAGQDLNATS